jgi:regulator of protease activity HflC (stomatin/prohibitin superfamily)
MAQLLAQQLSRLLQISLGVGLGLLGLSKSVYIVPPGHRAVIWDRLKGVKMGVVKSEGMHLLIPFWQTPYIMDVRKTPKNINTTSPSKGEIILHFSQQSVHLNRFIKYIK